MENQRNSISITSFLIFAGISLAILFILGAFQKEEKWSLMVGTEKDDLAVIQFASYSNKTQCINIGNSYLQQQGGKYIYFECGQDCHFSDTGKIVLCKITCDNTGCSD